MATWKSLFLLLMNSWNWLWLAEWRSGYVQQQVGFVLKKYLFRCFLLSESTVDTFRYLGRVQYRNNKKIQYFFFKLYVSVHAQPASTELILKMFSVEQKWGFIALFFLFIKSGAFKARPELVSHLEHGEIRTLVPGSWSPSFHHECVSLGCLISLKLLGQ